MTDAMAALAAHLKRLRRDRPDARLMVLFDLDGALLDPRTAEPLDGVFDVIRWLQLQPGCAVGLCAARLEARRAETLAALNRLGAPYRVHFSEDLLQVVAPGQEGATDAGVAVLSAFEQRGYRVGAMLLRALDPSPALAQIAASRDILLLHAPVDQPYDVTRLASPRALPPQVDLVWHGLNDEPNLRQFLASDIAWGECDIHQDPRSGELVLHHDEYSETSEEPVDGWLRLDDLLSRLAAAGKSAKLDLKAGPELIAPALALVRRHGFPDDRLWLNGYVPLLGEAGFRRLAEAHPGAVIQAPIMFLAAQAASAPDDARQQIAAFSAWGMNRFSLDWRGAHRDIFFDQMEAWRFPVNLYGVGDLRAFLQAVMRLPRSVTADFNFPEWHFYGRGSGEGGVYYEYELRT